MAFLADRQTLKDIDLADPQNSLIVHKIKQRCKTAGARKKLFSMLEKPFDDACSIQSRLQCIRFFNALKVEHPMEADHMDFVDYYMEFKKPCLRTNALDSLYDYWKYRLFPKQDYYRIYRGTQEVIGLLKELSSFLGALKADDLPEEILNGITKAEAILKHPLISTHPNYKKASCFRVSKLDILMRRKLHEELMEIIDFYYTTEVYNALASLHREQSWCLPEVIQSEDSRMEITGLFHPQLLNPVTNDFSFPDKSNLLFITGPNMAGKSSYLKATALATYFFHLGFPVPAASMQSTVFNGLFTTINIPDDISNGMSHFKAELNRLKKIGRSLSESGKLVVILDELFRGTNSGEAQEATETLCRLMSTKKQSFFIVSSHFTVAAEAFRNEPSISLMRFDAFFKHDELHYSYHISPGISTIQLGIYLLKEEGLFKDFEEIAHDTQARSY